jgi:capsular polysaccharide export protein
VFGLQYNYWRWFFSQQKSDLAVTWNGLVSARRIFMLAARDAGVRTLFLERGPLPNTITADPVGVNFANGLPRTAAPYLAWMGKHPEADGVWRPIAEQLKQRPSAPRHNTSGRAPPPMEQPFVFLPLQKQGIPNCGSSDGRVPGSARRSHSLAAPPDRCPPAGIFA